MREFSQHGYDGSRIDRIAKLAKVNKAMIYYHFKCKESLYERVLLDNVTGIRQTIENSLAGGDDPIRQLYDSIRNYVRYMLSLDEQVTRIILRELSGGGKYLKKIALPNLIVPIHGRIIGIIEECQKRGLIRDVNPHYLFFQTVGAINFFNFMRMALGDSKLAGIINRENTIDEYAQTLIDTLRIGVERRES